MAAAIRAHREVAPLLSDVVRSGPSGFPSAHGGEAKHRAGARGLLVKPRIRIGGGGMGGIGSLLALENDFGIAVLAAGAMHRVCLGFGRLGLIFGGASGPGGLPVSSSGGEG